MYFPGDQLAQIDHLLETYAALCRTIDLPGGGRDVRVLPGCDCSQLVPPGQFARLESGSIEVRLGERIAFILQPGDFFLFPKHCPDWPLDYVVEESGELDLVSGERLNEALGDGDFANKFTELLMAQTLIMSLAYAGANRYGVRPKAGFQRQPAGTILIEFGTTANEIYTLLRGQARVELDGIVVGHVQEGEIFGVLAALTDSPRSANVIAETDVTLMAVPADQFIRLVQAQPETFMRLLRTLSRQIAELNRRLVDALRQTRPTLKAVRNGKGPRS